MPRFFETEIDELDAAAVANLSKRGVAGYEFRKRQLLGRGAQDVEDILRGWIWDEIESESQPE